MDSLGEKTCKPYLTQIQSHRKGRLILRRYIKKYSDLSTNTNHLLSATTKTSTHSVETVDSNPSLEIYEEAKAHLKEVAEYRKKFVK